MKNNSTPAKEDPPSQLGGTDQIEQLAADIATQADHAKVSDQDRKHALDQMKKMAPPPQK